MLQNLWDLVKAKGLEKDTLVTCSKHHEEIVRNQIGNLVSLVLEPERRDTFPAIALSCAYLWSEQQVDEDEVVVISPVDVDVDQHYLQALMNLSQKVAHSAFHIGLVGIHPTYPYEKYGYIVPQEDVSCTQDWQKVKRFVEKPLSKEAERFIARGALWNGGVFAFKLSYLKKKLRSNGWSTTYQTLLHHYEKLPRISFDHHVVEKEQELAVQTYNGRWNDLGTWKDWLDRFDVLETGNQIYSDNCQNVHVINKLSIPVVTIGLEDLIVVSSSNGILVANKEEANRLKHITRKMEKEKSTTTQIFSSLAAEHTIRLKPGEQWKLPKSKEASICMVGLGEVKMSNGSRDMNLWQGDVIRIQPNAEVSVYAVTTVQLIRIPLDAVNEL